MRKGIGDDDPPQFWAWNDPFGFMPVYYYHNENSCILSSHWDCLVPSIASLQLDWDIVAEYITFGTTLGGGGNDAGCGFDRTFIQVIKNMGPGYSCFLRLVPLEGPEQEKKLHLSLTRYIKCYGACEEMLCEKHGTSECNTESSLTMTDLSCTSSEKNSAASIRGVQVVDMSKKSASFSLISSSSNLDCGMFGLLFGFIMDCVEEAQGCATQAALTGGGDTRLILTCLLLLRQQKQQQQQQHRQTKAESRMIFQTHSKQPTDWQIARHLAQMFQLKHRRINPVTDITQYEGRTRSIFPIFMIRLH